VHAGAFIGATKSLESAFKIIANSMEEHKLLKSENPEKRQKREPEKN